MGSKGELEALIERLKKEKAEYEEYVERQVTHIIGIISQVIMGDFTVRSEHEREDDLGALAMGINMMIGEIGKLNKDLEEKITALEKTKKELEERLEELERMHKVTMGREKKIIELKDEIWELEKKLEEKKE